MTWKHRVLTGAPAAVVAATWILWRVRHRLPLPASASVVELEHWYEQAGAGGLAAVLVWMAGVAIAVWLSTAVALQVLSGWIGSLRAVADAVSPAALRRLGPALASVSLTTGLGLGSPVGAAVAAEPVAEEPVAERGRPADEAPARAPDPESGTATMTRLDVASPPTTVAPTTTSIPEAPGAPPIAPEGPTTTTSTTIAGVEPIDRDGSEGPVDQDGSHLPPAPPAVPVPVPVPAHPITDAQRLDVGAETIRVEPGDSFWSIAEEVLADGGGDPTEREVARYWRTLIGANQDRLVAAGNPDLLLPGQELVLPAR